MTKFIVFGLQRSGTTFLETNIKNNLSGVVIGNAFSRGDIWKHAFSLETPSRHVGVDARKWYNQETADKLNHIPHVFLHKNPYTWIESLLNNKVDLKRTYPLSFKRNNNDDVMINHINVTYLAELWRDHAQYWLSKGAYRIRYEDVIVNADNVLEEIKKISKHFNLKMVDQPISTQNVRMTSTKFDETRRESLLSFHTPRLDGNELSFKSINSIIPNDLMAKLGYEKKTQSSTPKPVVQKKPNQKKVLIIASGQSAVQFKDYDFVGNDWTVVAVNNAWQMCRDELNYWIRPGDYKGDVFANPKQDQVIVKSFKSEINKFGGQRECGYSITLTAAYWSLLNLKPDVIAFLGADMNYTPDKETGATSFYGVGYDIKTRKVSDPDRMAETYKRSNQSPEEYLREVYKRFEKVAKEYDCGVYNISKFVETRLPYQRVDIMDIDAIQNNGPYKELISKRKCGHEGVSEFWWLTSDSGAYGNERDGPLFDWLQNKEDFMSQVKQFHTVIQAGGNCGMYPRFYGNYFQKVITFEPCPKNFACLDLNCVGSKYDKYMGGLGNTTENRSIQNTNKRNVGVHKIKEEPGEVKMYRIDDLNLSHCDLIHLDVEGYEQNVLNGAVETIKKFKPVVIVERSNGQNTLKNLGYEQYKKLRMDTVFVPKN